MRVSHYWEWMKEQIIENGGMGACGTLKLTAEPRLGIHLSKKNKDFYVYLVFEIQITAFSDLNLKARSVGSETLWPSCRSEICSGIQNVERMLR